MSLESVIAIASTIVVALAAAIAAMWRERITKRDLQEVQAKADAEIAQKEKENRELVEEVQRQYRERSLIAERRNADAEVMTAAFDALREASKAIDANTSTLGRLERDRDRAKGK